MGFASTTLAVRTADGHNVVLLEPLVYVTKSGETITVPAGATSDGASTPRFLWPTIPPFGMYWLAAVLHDYLYRRTQKPKAECDNLLLEAMESLGVEKVLASAIYEGVNIGGQAAFDADRRAQIA
jgi:hypothetical protein